MAAKAEIARNTRAVASQRSIRRVSPRSAGALNRQENLWCSVRGYNQSNSAAVAALPHSIDTKSAQQAKLLTQRFRRTRFRSPARAKQGYYSNPCSPLERSKITAKGCFDYSFQALFCW